jgi:hypothetical protein
MKYDALYISKNSWNQHLNYFLNNSKISLIIIFYINFYKKMFSGTIRIASIDDYITPS